MRNVFILLACTFICGGCASNKPKAVDQIYSKYEANRVANYTNYASPAADGTSTGQNTLVEDPLGAAETDKTQRNRVMNDLILMIDNNYYKSEASLVGHKSWVDFSGSLAVTGLSTAGTIVTGNDAKTLLSALVTAINSTKTSINTDLLQNQTLIAVVAKMHDLRATKMADIRTSMKTLNTQDYPLSYGLVDLLEYYNDGTFSGALQSMTEQSGAATVAAKAQIAATKNYKGNYSYDSDAQLIEKFWKPGGKLSAANDKALKAWISDPTKNTSGAPDIATLIYNSQFAAARAQIVKDVVNKK